MNSSASDPEPILNEWTSRTPPSSVPRMISEEPPPTSTTPISPSTGWPRPLVAPMKASRALVVLAEDVDRKAGRRLDLGRDLLAVLGLADRGRRDDPDRLGAELLSEPNLGGDDVGDLGDLAGRDRAVLLLRALDDPRVGALLHDLAELAFVGLGHEHASGIRADVDRGAEHLPEPDLVRGTARGPLANRHRSHPTILTPATAELRVLDDDRLERIAGRPAAVDRLLQRRVDVLPADHEHRVDRAVEEGGEGRAVDPVSLLLEPADVVEVLLDVLERLETVEGAAPSSGRSRGGRRRAAAPAPSAPRPRGGRAARRPPRCRRRRRRSRRRARRCPRGRTGSSCEARR